VPTHEVEKITGALNPPSEFTTTLVPPLSPGIVDTVDVSGRIEKSEGRIATAGATGANTVRVLPRMTGISVEWEMTPFVAVTSSM